MEMGTHQEIPSGVNMKFAVHSIAQKFGNLHDNSAIVSAEIYGKLPALLKMQSKIGGSACWHMHC